MRFLRFTSYAIVTNCCPDKKPTWLTQVLYVSVDAIHHVIDTADGCCVILTSPSEGFLVQMPALQVMNRIPITVC